MDATDARIRFLVEQLRYSSDDMEALQAELVSYGERALPFLTETLQDPNLHIHLGVVAVLNRISAAGSERATDALVAMLDDPDAAMRLAAAQALVEKRRPEAVRTIREMMQSWPEGVSSYLLGYVEDPEAQQLLLQRLTAPNPFVVLGASQALLRQQGDVAEVRTRALQALDTILMSIAGLKTEVIVLRRNEPGTEAGASQREKGSFLRYSLPEESDHYDTFRNEDLLNALHKTLVMAQDYTVPLCIAALQHPDANVRLVAANALSAMKEPNALTPPAR